MYTYLKTDERWNVIESFGHFRYTKNNLKYRKEIFFLNKFRLYAHYFAHTVY